MAPLSYVIVGSGWRAMFFARIGKRFPEQFRLQFMLCRSEEKAARIRREMGIPTTVSQKACEASRPDFVVVAVNKAAAFAETKVWAEKGFAVFSETPAGMTVEELKALWALKEQGSRIQVAEQYCRYPVLAAGLRAIRQGKLGAPYGVVLSAAHDYHGASLIRHMLDIGPEPMKLSGRRYSFPVTETDSRYGAVTDGSVTDRVRDVITIEFASGKTAWYDFSGVQYHSFIRSRHINVQGPKGEWNDTVLRYVDGEHHPVEEPLTAYLNPACAACETEAVREESRVWSPTLSLSEAQDEYAIASMMLDLRAYLDGGEEVYPLAEALEDAYTRILMEQAVTMPGVVVESEHMPWHRTEDGQ